MNKKIFLFFLLGIFLAISGCVPPQQPIPYQSTHHQKTLQRSEGYEEKGIASWYGRRFHRKRTSSGERYNMYHLTAAHKTLPLNTKVKVTNLRNGRQVVVKVNDRGPFIPGRLIDLSYAAAKKLGMVGAGVAPVSVKAIS